MMKTLRPILYMCSLVLLAACGGGGGGGGGADGGGGGGGGEVIDPPTAKVPEGTGVIAIDMVGSWEIRDPAVVSSNGPNPVPPTSGTVFRIDSAEIVEIGGLLVAPDVLEVLLGPLESYANQVTPSTILYRVVVDRRDVGGVRDEISLAGGAVGPDSISVEALTSTQAVTDAEPIYTLSRYTLQRRNRAAPVQLARKQPAELVGAELHELFGNAAGSH